MNILMIIPTLSFGGAQNIAVGLAEEAYLKGCKITFIVFFGNSDYSKRLQKIDCEVIHLRYQNGFGFTAILSLLKLRKALCGKIVSCKPDIIHTHLFLTKMLLFNKKFAIPLIDTQHDISPWWVKKSINDKIKTYVEKQYANFTSDKIVSISKAVKVSIITVLKINESKVNTIFNFVEKSSYPVNYNFSEEKFMISVITRIQIKKKGLDFLIDTIDLLINLHQLKNVSVTIVGDGPDMKLFKSMICERNLNDYFIMAGYQKDVYKYYSESHLVVMPSRWEGFGLTAAEAAMAGRAVVGFNIPGLNEVVKNNETGILVHPFNVNLLADEISNLLKNLKRLKVLSVSASINAQKRFDKERAFLHYMKQYKELELNTKDI